MRIEIARVTVQQKKVGGENAKANLEQPVGQNRLIVWKKRTNGKGRGRLEYIRN